MGFIRIYLLNFIFYSMKFKCREKIFKINVTQNNHNVANQVGVCKNYLTQVKDPLNCMVNHVIFYVSI